MIQTDKYPKWLFVVFPAVAMMLGWGLRGHIGGGPYGAMIPGAMVALSIALLLELPVSYSALLVVFGVAGIGLGGEMTYGQTLGFLREPDTVWWGILATTVKGGVWGIFGGAVFAMGLIARNLSKRTILYGILIMMVGMILGFKLINEPMLIYFSDRAKPRSESWAALLFGAISLIVYLWSKITKEDFKLVKAFSKWGLIGGALGFGIGGLWMVLGSQLSDTVIFRAWWKAMEFTFGLLLGGAMGLAAYMHRKAIQKQGEAYVTDINAYSMRTSYKEMGVTLVVGLLIFWFISFGLNPVIKLIEPSSNFLARILVAVLSMFKNYAFSGLIMIMAALYFPRSAWQLGIALTFCHTMIDLGRDHIVKVVETAPEVVSAIVIILSTAVVGVFIAYYQGRAQVKKSMMMILTWSTVFVSTFKIIYYPQKMNPGGSLSEIIIQLFIVDIAFLVFAIWVTRITYGRLK